MEEDDPELPEKYGIAKKEKSTDVASACP